MAVLIKGSDSDRLIKVTEIIKYNKPWIALEHSNL